MGEATRRQGPKSSRSPRRRPALNTEIRPSHLIIQAKGLAGGQRKRGKPNHTNHRRAVSAAIDNHFEARFAKFLERATDVTAFAKLTLNRG